MKTIPKLLLLLFFISPLFKNVYGQHLANEQLTAKYSHALNQDGFIKNVGQFTNEKNIIAGDVLYGATIGHCNIFITSKGLSYINYTLKSKEAKPGANKLIKSDSIFHYKYDIERVDISLDGARVSTAQAQETKLSNNEAVYNYYTIAHTEGVTGLHPVKEILFRNVYAGVDWSIQIVPDKKGRPTLKYNFILRPGADIKKIRLRYSGNTLLSLNDAGELTAHTPLTNFLEKAPVSYIQESHRQVNLKYKLKGQMVSFEGPFRKSDSTLVIDPEVFWATYLPSTQPGILYSHIFGSDVATDANANIFVSLTAYGKIPFMTANPGNGAFYQDFSVTAHGAMIIMKFTPNGKLLWSTYFSGNGQTGGNMLTTDKNGNLFAAGKIIYDYIIDNSISYTNIPLKDNGGYFDTRPKENFITKFDINGKLLWSTFFGGFSTYPLDMTTDDAGKLYITGWADWADFPLVDPGNGAYMESSLTPAQLIFINQFGSDSKLEWSTHIQGDDYDPLSRIEVDKKGNIYVGLNNRSRTFPYKDAGGYFYTADVGFVIIKFNTDRQITWCTGIQAGGFEFEDLVTDDEGNLYVASGRGVLWKFNEKTELLWKKTYTDVRMFFYNRMVYDKKNKLIHILGQMNDFIYDFPTKNTECNGSFFYDGKAGNFPTATCPIFTTYTLDGDLQYCSLADWPYEYYDYANFTTDPNGDLIYLFKDNRNGIANPALTDPGSGAYYHPEVNDQGQTPFLMKLSTSELNITSSIKLSAACDSNNIINLQALCGRPPFKYLWSNGDTTSVVKVAAGSYTVKVTDDNFLTKILFFNISGPAGSVVDFKVIINDAHCSKKDGSITINSIEGGNAPYLFSFNNGTFTEDKTYNSIDSGTYFITVKDKTGCLVKDTFNVNNIAGPLNVKPVVTASSCNKNDGTININEVTGGTAPYIFAINTQPYSTSGVFNNLSPATYKLSVIDSAGCELLDSSIITGSLPPDSIQVDILPDHCLSSIGSLTINRVFGGNSPFIFSTDNNNYTDQSTFKALKSGSYFLYVKDSRDCLFKKTFLIDNVPGPDKIYYQKDDAVCGNSTGKIQIDSIANGNSPYTFSLTGLPFQNSFLFKNISFGNYTLTVKDQFGCTASTPVNINYVKQYGIDILPHDSTVCYGKDVTLEVSFENEAAVKSIKWNTGEKNNQITIAPLQNSPVSVIVTDENGCTIKDTAYVKVKACNTGSKCVAIPAAFTPNSDGLNDGIGPIINGCLLNNLVFRVYNRYGQMIFESKDTLKKWDGKINGMEQPQGSYIFTCSFTADDNTSQAIKGNFLLLR